MMLQILFIAIIISIYLLFRSSIISTSRNVGVFIDVIIVVLILQSSLRHFGVGSDTYAYYLDFENVKLMSWLEILYNFKEVYIDGIGKDAGYPLLEKCFQILCPSFRIFLIFVAAIFFYALSSVFKKYLHTYTDVLMAVAIYLMLFYSFFSITGIRQTLAVALSMIAFIALLDKKWLKFIVLIFIAFFIHKSAGILLIFPLVIYTFKPQRVAFVSIILFLASVVFRSRLVEMFREAAEYEVYETGLPIKLMAFLFIMSVMVFYTLYKRGFSNEIQKVVKLSFIAFMWIPLLGWDSLFMREILYFSIYFVILIPICFKQLFVECQTKSLFVLAFVLFCLAVFLKTTGDYKFFWMDM